MTKPLSTIESLLPPRLLGDLTLASLRYSRKNSFQPNQFLIRSPLPSSLASLIVPSLHWSTNNSIRYHMHTTHCLKDSVYITYLILTINLTNMLVLLYRPMYGGPVENSFVCLGRKFKRWDLECKRV